MNVTLRSLDVQPLMGQKLLLVFSTTRVICGHRFEEIPKFGAAAKAATRNCSIEIGKSWSSAIF